MEITCSTTNVDVVTFYNRIMDSSMKRDASYQRASGVWRVDMMKEYIDSIFYKFNATPIIVVREANKNDIIIDGIQRTTVIKLFMRNHIPWKDDSTNRFYVYDSNLYDDSNDSDFRNLVVKDGYSKKKYPPLPEDLKRKFDRSTLSMYVYTELDEVKQQKLFERINKSAPLKSGEKIASQDADLKKFVSELFEATGRDKHKDFKGFCDRAAHCKHIKSIVIYNSPSYPDVTTSYWDNTSQLQEKEIELTDDIKDRITSAVELYQKWCDSYDLDHTIQKMKVCLYVFSKYKSQISVVAKKMAALNDFMFNFLNEIDFSNSTALRSSGIKQLNKAAHDHFVVNNTYKLYSRYIPDSVRQKLISKHPVCSICGHKDRLEIDHKKSLFKGGTSETSNLQVLCMRCNRGKGSN